MAFLPVESTVHMKNRNCGIICEDYHKDVVLAAFQSLVPWHHFQVTSQRRHRLYREASSRRKHLLNVVKGGTLSVASPLKRLKMNA